ncbi:MAG: hypothetical protein WBG90_19805 [Saonia sp.]
MKHFDIEIYAKETLEAYTLSPDADTWQKLSDELEKQQHKKRQKISYIRITMMVAILIFGIQFVEDENDIPAIISNTDYIITATTELTDKDKTPKVQDIKKEDLTGANALMASRTSQNGKSAVVQKIKGASTRSNNTIQQEKIEPIESLQNNKTFFDKFATKVDRVVTDAEIDSLMRKARENVEREKSLLAAREALAHDMLADIEKETKRRHDKKFYQNVKRGFMKLKSAIAN